MGPLTRPSITSLGITNNTITVNFTGASSDSATAFTLLSASSVPGPYTSVTSASMSLVSPGVFKATANKNGAIQFYRLMR